MGALVIMLVYVLLMYGGIGNFFRLNSAKEFPLTTDLERFLYWPKYMRQVYKIKKVIDPL